MGKLALLGGEPVRTRPFPSYPRITDEEVQAVVEVLRSGVLSSRRGARTREFEEEFAKYVGVSHAAATSSGTTALQLALAAIGVGPGDEVIVPAYTFTSSATAVLMQNAIPVFADVDPLTYNLSAEDLERRVTPRTKAVVVVHLFGLPADMDPIMEVAEEHGLYVIEDCAQAHGARYKGRRVGSIGHLGAFSFYESKNMMTGEGGMVTTDDDELAERVRMLRDHCEIRGLEEYMRRPDRRWPLVNMLGYNYRMTELQAAIGLVQLRKLDAMNERRRRLARLMSEGLRRVAGVSPPHVPEYAYHVYHVYCCRYSEGEVGVPRDLFVEALRAEGVPASPGYTRPLYANPLYRERLVRTRGCPFTCPFYEGAVSYEDGTCPVAEELCYGGALWLPIHSEMSEEDAMDVVAAVEKIVEHADELKGARLRA